MSQMSSTVRPNENFVNIRVRSNFVEQCDFHLIYQISYFLDKKKGENWEKTKKKLKFNFTNKYIF